MKCGRRLWTPQKTNSSERFSNCPFSPLLPLPSSRPSPTFSTLLVSFSKEFSYIIFEIMVETCHRFEIFRVCVFSDESNFSEVRGRKEPERGKARKEGFSFGKTFFYLRPLKTLSRFSFSSLSLLFLFF